MKSQATTVVEYLSELPEERRRAIEAVRAIMLQNLHSHYEEGMQYGMIGYYVPHRVYPAGYHCDPRQPLPFAALGAQKNYLSLYLMCLYGGGDYLSWFQQAWAKTGKKLDMGKSCLRSRKPTIWRSRSLPRRSGACRPGSTSSTARRQWRGPISAPPGSRARLVRRQKQSQPQEPGRDENRRGAADRLSPFDRNLEVVEHLLSGGVAES
jgi:hypothetical protein